jgi:hypothetical protein
VDEALQGTGVAFSLPNVLKSLSWPAKDRRARAALHKLAAERELASLGDMPHLAPLLSKRLAALYQV